ncbi:hypothetical protein DKX38_001747 [Salix brachista]|uniref:Uncharacterized protein n=1 Tax=Salix brachista TaxID=2182728 RepID=A0A5N5P6J6_9ROSI|nr:hypothetical protein DKX38_001747 [Salix brachista]
MSSQLEGTKEQYLVPLASSVESTIRNVKAEETRAVQATEELWVFDLQKEDLKLSNKLCELPQSHAFGFGIAALTWLVIAQVVGNVMICAHFRHRENSKAMKPKIATGLLVFSWWGQLWNCSCFTEHSHQHEQKAGLWERMVGSRMLRGQRWSVYWLRGPNPGHHSHLVWLSNLYTERRQKHNKVEKCMHKLDK